MNDQQNPNEESELHKQFYTEVRKLAKQLAESKTNENVEGPQLADYLKLAVLQVFEIHKELEKRNQEFLALKASVLKVTDAVESELPQFSDKFEDIRTDLAKTELKLSGTDKHVNSLLTEVFGDTRNF